MCDVIYTNKNMRKMAAPLTEGKVRAMGLRSHGDNGMRGLLKSEPGVKERWGPRSE
jgi:hypothetical protein